MKFLQVCDEKVFSDRDKVLLVKMTFWYVVSVVKMKERVNYCEMAFADDIFLILEGM